MFKTYVQFYISQGTKIMHYTQFMTFELLLKETNFLPILEEINALSSNEKFEGNLLYRHHQNLDSDTTFDQYNLEKINTYISFAQKATSVLEIGFNAGHSALVLLLSNVNLTYLGIDIENHTYTPKAASILKKFFRERFELKIRTSKEKLTNLDRFDLIICDGDHSKKGIFRDLIDICIQGLPGTILIVDDMNVPHIRKTCMHFCKLNLLTVVKNSENFAIFRTNKKNKKRGFKLFIFYLTYVLIGDKIKNT